MNELKPEYVMKDMEQYVHCANIMGSATLSKDEMNAIFALLREMKKQIRELDADVENYKSIAEYQQNCNVKRYHIIKEKDAEIERLTKERDDARRDCAVAEKNHHECAKEVERYRETVGTLLVKDGEVVGRMIGKDVRYIEKSIAEVFKRMAVKQARAEAIDDFAERLEKTLIEGGIYPVLVKNAIEKTKKELKGAENGKSDD